METTIQLTDREKRTCIDQLYEQYGGDEPENYFPELYDKEIDEEGNWIMIIYPPYTKIKVQKLSIWFALQDTESDLGHRFSLGRDQFRLPVKLVQIQTPEGTLKIFPREYTKVDLTKYAEFISTDHIKMNLLSENVSAEAEINDKIHYIRTRGIKHLDALAMVANDLKDPNFCYFTFHEEYVKMFTR